MHSQESTCKLGKRRRVARRSLNALGGVSGLCRFVNDDQAVREIKLNMQFADSLESIRSAEKSFKAVKANQKRKVHYDKARKKLELAKNDKFVKSHASKLTIEQMKAVAFIDCAGVRLAGKADHVREQLKNLLPDDLGVPEFPSQMDFYMSSSSADSGTETDDNESDEDALLSFTDLRKGKCVDVYWAGEKQWFHGKVTDLSKKDKMFEVFYFSDSQQLWHYACDYAVRESEA